MSELQTHYGYTMTEKDLAACPLGISGDWDNVGLAGNEAQFVDENGNEKCVILPFYDQGRVDRQLVNLITRTGQPVSFFQMFPNQHGRLFCNVSVEKEDGIWYAVCQLADRPRDYFEE